MSAARTMIAAVNPRPQIDSENLIPVSAEHLDQWKNLTVQIRAHELVLAGTIEPVPGSALHQANAIYPREKVSAWARSYLLAAAEHLGFWADLVAPYEFDPSVVNKVRFRQYLILGRSGWEAAAHAAWLLDVPSLKFEECVQRFVRLMHRDFTYHRDALVADQADTTAADERIANLATSAEQLPFAAPRSRVPGYEAMLREAAMTLGADENRWAYLWKAASGATHGQNWFGLEGFDLIARAELEPGVYHTVAIPDPSFITETFAAATQTLARGTQLLLHSGGHDPLALLGPAIFEVGARMQKKDQPGDRPDADIAQAETD
ncbi:hypothetical protein [Nocardia sp. NPDC051832]|uniref:hypothetical protein n=1 Tax=Nocardia sp. NPDC051832 TaxID=3155673 RepID=UPI003435C1A8